jgi:hypothetical protein
VDSSHWGHGIDRALLNWGMERARSRGWDILALAPSVINPWTLDAFIDARFKEVGSLDIFWSSYTALHWTSGQRRAGRRGSGLPAPFQPVTPVRKRRRGERPSDNTGFSWTPPPVVKRRRVIVGREEGIDDKRQTVCSRHL